MGCGQPAGEAGFNIARVVAVLAGLDEVPGVTVNRYCSSSLQTIRMAAHAIKAGEGDVFIAAGVETVSRYGNGASDTAPNPALRRAGERTAERSPVGGAAWTPAEGLPDIYIAMGQTAENVVEAREVYPPGDGRVRQAVAGPGGRQRRERVLRRRDHAVTLPDGTVVSKDDGPRAGTTVEGLGPAQAGVPPGRARSRPATPARSTTAPPRWW